MTQPLTHLADGRAGEASSTASPRPWPGRWLVGLAVVSGVALRLGVGLTSLGRPDSDEVIAGLMARHLGDGFPASFWGQHYGGTLELVPVWASLRLFGMSVPGLRVPTLVLAVVNAVLVWRCARRLMAPGPAAVAGLLAWVWPPAAVWFGMREMLFYVPTLTLGLVALLLALRLARATGWAWWAQWAGLGLALGLGWWTSPNIVYFVVPVAVALLAGQGTGRPAARAPGAWRGVLVAAAAALVGALPWLVTNVGSGFPALHDSVGFPRTGTYPGRVWWFFTHGLPAELGFRTVGTLAWIGGVVGVVAYLVALVALAVALRAAAGDRVRLTADGAGLVAFPFLMALIPFAMAQANLRYLFFLTPFLCLVLARLATGRQAAVVLVALAVGISALGLVRLHTVSEQAGTTFQVGAVGDLSPAIAALDAEGVTAVYADYWVAYRLVYESHERIAVRPSAGTQRSAAERAAVEASPRVAWVVEQGAQAEALLAALDQLQVGHHQVEAGELVVVFTDRPVTPDEVPDDARAPAGAEMAPPPGHTY